MVRRSTLRFWAFPWRLAPTIPIEFESGVRVNLNIAVYKGEEEKIHSATRSF